MVLDLLTQIGIGIAAGGGAGALASFMGFRASGEPFDNSKLVNALITGIVAGVSLVFLNLASFKIAAADPSGYAFVELLGTVTLGAFGVEMFRAKLASIQANKQAAPATFKSG